MTSTLSWLDYSEHERRQFDEIVARFSERDTRDELGLGSVRDAFADILFPGTSTIQTRVRYMLFIPWMYLEVERLRPPVAADLARSRELDLVDRLAQSSDTNGVIGIDARRALKRLASSVYWQGLGTWGIRVFPGSQDQYHRVLDAGPVAQRSQRNDDGEPIDGATRRHWHAGLPPAPRGFPAGASFALTRAEAQYLRERLLSHVPSSLLAFLADRGQPHERVSFPWQHPQLGEFPELIRQQLAHTRDFSEIMYGASLLYNLMLAQKSGRAEWEAHYLERLASWADALEEGHERLVAWRRPIDAFWQVAASGGAIIPQPARRFTEAWLDLAIPAGQARKIPASRSAHRLIHERESALKRALARLDNKRALELWTGAAGAYQHDFRWPTAQDLIADVLAGLAQEANHACS